MIRTAIVDDEIKGRLYLRQMCDKFLPNIRIVGEATNATEAQQLLEIEKPDLIFLDIEMPCISGIEWLKGLRNIDFEVIFITAFNQYAVEAFRLGAVDYLLKPVNHDELRQAVQRIMDRRSRPESKVVLKEALQSFGSSFSKITIPALNGFEFIDFKEIIFLESDSNYTVIHLLGGKKITATRTLGDFEELLENHGFFLLDTSISAPPSIITVPPSPLMYFRIASSRMMCDL